MTSDLLLRLSVTVMSLLVTGSVACLPLFHWNLREFFASTLWIKIVWWLPIFLVFLALCYGGAWVAFALVILIIIQSLREYYRQPNRPRIVAAYLMFFVIATTSIAAPWHLSNRPVPLLIVLCFSSVLSDVCAFFAGSYASWHKLPAWINPRKSWEGVAGQVIGAFLGAGLIWIVAGIGTSWWLIAAIGCASAFGDLFNSAAKRQLNIKDWGATIPGHGGVLDRFSSLSTAFLVIALLLLLGQK